MRNWQRMNILAVSYSFPHDSRPYSGVFVKNSLEALASLGHQVTVVAPQIVLREHRMPFEDRIGRLRVLRPRYVSAGALKCLGYNSYRLTQDLFDQCVLRTVKRTGLVADVIYSHFMLPSGHAALNVGTALRRPVFCTLGESSLESHERKLPIYRLTEAYRRFNGLIFNAAHTRAYAQSHYGIPDSRCIVVPNGVDPENFFVRDKEWCRRKLELPVTDDIVIFVGSFIERKGPLRVLRACSMLSPSPKLIFVGSGPQALEGKNVLYSGVIPHELLPYYLSASDVFVLPTLSEGMPNAILEALACGVPIVTSPIAPNVQILGERYPLFCSPLDVDSVATKIRAALHSPVRRSECYFSTVDRARAISGFMEQRM